MVYQQRPLAQYFMTAFRDCHGGITNDHSTASTVDRTPDPRASASAAVALPPLVSGSDANEGIAGPAPGEQSRLQEPQVQAPAPVCGSRPHSAISIAGAEKDPSAEMAAGAGKSNTGSACHGQG